MLPYSLMWSIMLIITLSFGAQLVKKNNRYSVQVIYMYATYRHKGLETVGTPIGEVSNKTRMKKNSEGIWVVHM